jgi:hypothetical protein
VRLKVVGTGGSSHVLLKWIGMRRGTMVGRHCLVGEDVAAVLEWANR